jgi:hypothetical protein
MLEYDELYCKKSSGEDVFSKLGTSFEEVMNLPISYLHLNPSLDRYLQKCKKTVNGEMQPAFTVLGDLVNCGKEKLEAIIQKNNNIHLREVELMQNVEEELAKYALKLKGSDFTVYNIRCSQLNFTDEDSEAVAWLKSNSEYETISDLYTVNQKGIVRRVGSSESALRIIASLRKAIMEYGVYFESTSYKFDNHLRKMEKLYNAGAPLFPQIKESVKQYRLLWNETFLNN